MKRIYTGLSVLLITAALPLTSGAQLLKNLVNNMKQNIANKSSGRTATPSGKPDTGAKGKSAYDSTYMAQMFAKVNKPKPSISPEDSAAAIKSFIKGTGGSGILYRYQVNYTFIRKNGKDSAAKDTMQVAVTDGHNVRTDIGLLGSAVRVLGHASLPRYSITIYPSSRTFRFNIIDTAALNSGDRNSYQVTKVGNETVQGYSCVHSKMTVIAAGTKTGIVEDIWTSQNVPGYATMKKLISMQNVTPKMMQALEQAGAGGFFVRLTMQTKEMFMDMVLASADRKSFPDSMFQIPSGYTEETGANMFGNSMSPLQKGSQHPRN